MSLTSPEALARAGLVPRERVAALRAVAERYAVAITPAVAALIAAEDSSDPIARQFVPHPDELVLAPEERADPIGDARHSPVKGIVHRYPDRVLLKPLHACPVYCRFCFRREVVGPGGDGTLTGAELDAALDYVRARPEIWEVVVTGGDPLALAPRRLTGVGRRLAAIPHVRVVRFHTRVPVVAPERIDAALVAALKASDRAVFVALHANHPRELTPEARAACARLVDAGVPMIGQSVLLAGVNDDPATLAELMRALVESRVKPYYLHHPDLAPGTAHLRVDLARGRDLVQGLRGRVSGLCQPTYVLDIPGGHGKVPAGAEQVMPDGDRWRVTDPAGGVHIYPPEDEA